MAPIRIDASHFSPDTQAFLAALAEKKVRYLIVGGEAVILHGHVRLTGDVDFFFSRDRPEDLVPGGIVIQFGQPPNRIDLLNAIDGITFDEAWPGRVDAVIQAGQGDVHLAFIGLDALVKNKRASGRPKDLDDLSYLERQQGW